MKRLVTFILLILACSTLLLTTIVVKAQDDDPPTIESTPPISTTDTEVAVLEAQLEQMRSSDERLFQIVIWSLSAILALGIVLVGCSWFSSSRNYNKDIESFRREIRTDLSEQLSTAKSDLASSVDDRMEKSSDNIIKMTESNISNLARKIDLIKDSLDEDITDAQIDILILEAFRWEMRGVISNVITCHLELIELSNRRGTDWRIATSLELIIGHLNKGEKLSSHVAFEVNTVLDKLSSKHSNDIAIVKDLISKSKL